jgi:hypothetical protein
MEVSSLEYFVVTVLVIKIESSILIEFIKYVSSIKYIHIISTINIFNSCTFYRPDDPRLVETCSHLIETKVVFYNKYSYVILY